VQREQVTVLIKGSHVPQQSKVKTTKTPAMTRERALLYNIYIDIYIYKKKLYR